MIQLELSSLIIDITNECNLNCAHCFNRKSFNSARYLSLEQIDMIVSKAIPYKVEKVYLSGGEPLLHPELYNILRCLTRKYPHIEIGIATNGTLLNDEILRCIELCGNVVVQISVDGSNAKIYEQTRGKGVFPAFCTGFEALAKSKIKKKTARTCISAINYKDVEPIYRMCVHEKIEPSFLFVSEMGNAIDNWGALQLTTAQKLSVIDTLERLNMEYGFKVGVPKPAYDCSFTQLALKHKNEGRSEYVGKWTLSVDVKGATSCCQFLQNHPIGNIFCDTIDEMFEGTTFKDLCSNAEQRVSEIEKHQICEKCLVKSICGGGCIAPAIDHNNLCLFDGKCQDRVMYAIFKENNYINH